MRRLAAILVIASFACLIQGANAQAGTATLAFADIGTTTADGSATGNILTAPKFALGDLISTGSGTGLLKGISSQDFSSVSFTTTPGANTSLSFSSSAFGTFTSTSLEVESKGTTSIAFYILGKYAGGTYDPSLSGPSSLTISFTQTSGGSISSSASFSIPPAGASAVPEPAGIVMGLTGVAVCGLIFHRRRSRAASA